MSQKKTFRQNLTGLTPVYAAIGALDLTVDTLKEMGARAAGEAGANLGELQGKAQNDVMKIVKGVKQVPSLALAQALDAAAKTQVQYSQLAERGERVVRNGSDAAPHTSEILHRAGDTVGDTVNRTRHAASSTYKAVRTEADQVVDAVTHTARIGQDAVQGVLHDGGVAARRVAPRRRPSARQGEEVRSRTAGAGVEAAGTTGKVAKKSPARKASASATAPAAKTDGKAPARKSAARKPRKAAAASAAPAKAAAAASTPKVTVTAEADKPATDAT